MSSAGKRIAIAGIVLLTAPGRSPAACSVADIDVGRAEVIVQGRATYVVGELANQCSDGTGVQIRLTLRDDEGNVLLTGDFWPASGRNIAAGGRRGFTYVVSPAERIPRRRAANVTVEVSAVRKW
ncbi:hypothetical protein DFR50_12954 [Roseiarcus fermentans]|uniref:Uncharacterized protein n=1 Tax=Roseiarcus fermentans TaxID=1473586 RepID=A0A366EXP5_9HYPH|nr:hypothetical protein [Roseiarcus fermentans]RBP07124.1 hypothetical protein DFR50_12954 [Roseiarcus fermentans]